MTKKLLVALCLLSMVFATTAIAAETYTEKFVQSKTQKIVDTEKKLQAKKAENVAKVNAQKEAQKKKEAELKAKIQAQKDAQAKKEKEVKAKIEAQKKKDQAKKAAVQKKIQTKKDAWNTLISK
ncbi:hypothetical protein IJ818_06910 [bacterium]|nr:hypothetical protein [bacterium]